uniref:1-acylglycerol-3-phosphate O-acyltransferase n=1 Tax=Hucho hucho TaxID=62062 RepID=A0A4W5LJK0_9TELE
MQKIISYPLSFIVLMLILLALVIFHPIQWICLNVFGYQAHKKSVDYLNFILLRIVHLLGTTFVFEGRESIPKGVPIIFVANHQSLYDIIAMIWFLRRFHPKFVSKKELGSGVPSVSFNLKHGGSVLIDRKDPKQAIPSIKKLSEYIEKNNRSAVIFPEGTRSKNGKPKEFAQSGVKILCKYAPSAYVVPIKVMQFLESKVDGFVDQYLIPVEEIWQPSDFLPNSESDNFLEEVKELREISKDL